VWENKLGNKNYFYGWFGTLSRSLEMYFFEVVKNLGHFSLFVEVTINIQPVRQAISACIWLGLSASQQCFSLIPNQPAVL